MKGFADASGAAPAAPSLFGAGNALTRREILETCDLHLKLRLFGPRMSMEDFQNNRRPIVNIHVRCFSNVANLCRRQVVVENDAVDF